MTTNKELILHKNLSHESPSSTNINTLKTLYDNLDKLKIENFFMDNNSVEFGKELSKEYMEFRDVAQVMEHPEFYKFYYKYMRDFNKFKKIIILMHVYDIISKYFYKKDPCEVKHNAYTKLSVLWVILKHCTSIKYLLKKTT